MELDRTLGVYPDMNGDPLVEPYTPIDRDHDAAFLMMHHMMLAEQQSHKQVPAYWKWAALTLVVLGVALGILAHVF